MHCFVVYHLNKQLTGHCMIHYKSCMLDKHTKIPNCKNELQQLMLNPWFCPIQTNKNTKLQELTTTILNTWLGPISLNIHVGSFEGGLLGYIRAAGLFRRASARVLANAYSCHAVAYSNHIFRANKVQWANGPRGAKRAPELYDTDLKK